MLTAPSLGYRYGCPMAGNWLPHMWTPHTKMKTFAPWLSPSFWPIPQELGSQQPCRTMASCSPGTAQCLALNHRQVLGWWHLLTFTACLCPTIQPKLYENEASALHSSSDLAGPCSPLSFSPLAQGKGAGAAAAGMQLAACNFQLAGTSGKDHWTPRVTGDRYA